MSSLTIYFTAYTLLLVGGILLLRLVIRREYLRRGRLSPLTSGLQALLFFLFGGFPALYLKPDWPAVHVGSVFHLVGLILVISGLVLILYGMFLLGLRSSLGRGRPALQTSGLYRLSRNPQALACGLYVAGFFLLWPSWYAAGWVIQYPVLIHTMILTEEEYLRRTYGQAYVDYCRNVPRYFRPLWQRTRPSI